MENFLVALKCEAGTDDEIREKTFKLLLEAEGYTGAETAGHQYYEDELIDDFNSPKVSKIDIKSIQMIIDDVDEDDEVSLSKIFVLSTYVSDYQGDKMKVNVVVRGFDIENIIELTRKEVMEKYKSEYSEVLSAKETDYFPICPLFKKQDNG